MRWRSGRRGAGVQLVGHAVRPARGRIVVLVDGHGFLRRRNVGACAGADHGDHAVLLLFGVNVLTAIPTVSSITHLG